MMAIRHGFAGRASWEVREDGRPLDRQSRFKCDLAAARPAISVRVRSAPPSILFAFAALASQGYVLVQHAPPVVAAGEPLDAASPGRGSGQPAAGSADPSPLSNDFGAFPAGRTSGLCGRFGGCGRSGEIFLRGAVPLVGPSPLIARYEPALFGLNLASDPKLFCSQAKTRVTALPHIGHPGRRDRSQKQPHLQTSLILATFLFRSNYLHVQRRTRLDAIGS